MNFVLDFIVTHIKFYYYILEAIVLFFVPPRFRYKNVKGQIVLITGSGSGIGRRMAHRFAKLGCKLVLWDINSEANEQTAAEVRQLNAEAFPYTCDLSKSDAVYRTANEVKDKVGDVDILVNNAGIVSGKKILQCSDAMIRKTMEVNALAHFWTVKAFLPAMLSRNRGHIVTVASSAGLFGASGLVDYCASKFAAVGLDDSLRAELHMQGKTGVHTTVVCPYLIDTGLFHGSQSRLPFLLPPLKEDYVAEKIVEAVLINKELLCLPRLIYIFLAAKHLLPHKAAHVASDFFGGNSLMDGFQGRSKLD
jgi:all-trans-retinol dehydrogenase (NAD+)